MPEFKIFTESKTDIKFLHDYISEHFGVKLSEDFAQLQEDFFYSLNSWAGYKNNNQAIASIKEIFEKERETILILDADNDFAGRRSEVTRDFQNYDIPVHLFLFPNDNANGSLETLLCHIAVEQDILRCFENYEGCIAGHQAPITKSKVYAYLDALLPAVNKKNNKLDLIQERNRNYRNTAHWNLHHDYLAPLHTFLRPFFP